MSDSKEKQETKPEKIFRQHIKLLEDFADIKIEMDLSKEPNELRVENNNGKAKYIFGY